jgi:glycosyltransferase involved in cell wall biosynthesis
MKILFVGTYPPPFGGIASHLNALLPSLVEKGFEVVSLSRSNSENVKGFDKMKNIYVNLKNYYKSNILSCIFTCLINIQIKIDLKWIKYFKTIVFAKFVKKICDEENIDLVFVYDNDQGLIIPILRRMNCSIPINLMIFGDFYLLPKTYLSMKRYYNLVLNESNLLMASSKYCADSIKNVLSLNFPTRVVYVGVDENIYYPADENQKVKSFLNIPESSFVYFFLGRFDKSMGVDFLIENAKKLLNIDENIYLILAGAKGDYSLQVKELSVLNDRIKYYENIPFEEIINFYHACDVYLAPTMQKHACMGVSIKEAMACGKPIIASNSGGIPEAISDGVNGFIISTNDGKLDSYDFIKKSELLYNDKLLRNKMSQEGLKLFSEKFTNEICLNNYLDIINELS